MLPLGLAPFGQRYSGRWIAPSPISPTRVPPLSSQASAVNEGRVASPSVEAGAGSTLDAAGAGLGVCGAADAPPQPALSPATTLKRIANRTMIRASSTDLRLALRLEQRVQFLSRRRRRKLIEAPLGQRLCGALQAAPRGTSQRATDAHAPHPQRRQ